jgi:Fe2+ or Zn2+ uptake regulation protein
MENIYINHLKCEKCGSVMPIPRKRGEKREKNHLKHLWCYKCKETTEFRENSIDLLERYYCER